jgi:hypothetical protein
MVFEQYNSGNNIIPPTDLEWDLDRIMLMQEKRDNLIAEGKLDGNTRHKNQDKLHIIATHYAMAHERLISEDTLTLLKRMEMSWDALNKYDTNVDSLSIPMLLAASRDLTYVNSQRGRNSLRTYAVDVENRTLENQEFLEGQVGYMLDLANQIDNPIQKGLYLQTFIYYLQPVNNGNKRLGQMMNWKILDDNDYPSFFVPNEDFERYLRLLNKACYGIDGKESDLNIYKLHDFLLQRIETSMELLKEAKTIRGMSKREQERTVYDINDGFQNRPFFDLFKRIGV